MPRPLGMRSERENRKRAKHRASSQPGVVSRTTVARSDTNKNRGERAIATTTTNAATTGDDDRRAAL